MSTLPVGISYVDWFYQIRTDYPELDLLPLRPVEDNWIDDVETLLRNPQCATFNVPRPQGFSGWREWADRFINSYGGIV